MEESQTTNIFGPTSAAGIQYLGLTLVNKMLLGISPMTYPTVQHACM
jgi:hypothetical protein